MYQSQISSLSNSLNITLENDISVITLDDNINHTNCSKIKWEKDNYVPLGLAKLIMPYSEDVSEYWIKYSGPVVIHANLNSHQNHVIASQITLSTGMSLNLKKALETNTESEYVGRAERLRFKNDEYNYAFIGKTSRFKQVGKTFIVYLEDLGWKFMQKVPSEFRASYIANQRVDEAFQAMCEFMGIEFAYSIADLSEYTFAADGYSIQKDGVIIENIPSLLKEWAKGTEDNEDQEEESTEEEQTGESIIGDTNLPESSGLIEYLNKQQSSQQTNNSSNNSINSSLTNAENATEEQEEETEEEDTENNQASINEKILKYQEEFDEKIKDLFIGNTYYSSNIADPVLNYDWITIQPQAATTTSNGTTSGSTSSTDSNTETDTDSSNSSSNSSSSSSNNSSSKRNGWYNGQLYENGKIHLYPGFINKLSKEQAVQKIKTGKNTYTAATLNRLKKRALGFRVS